MLFSKRPRELIREDIQSIISEKVPEGSEVEFKGALAARKGRVEPWSDGQNRIGDHARNDLLAEVVAFANAYGGWLLLVVEETKEKPARASKVAPLRVCRTGRASPPHVRDCIDPQVPMLEVEGVTADNEGSGIDPSDCDWAIVRCHSRGRHAGLRS